MCQICQNAFTQDSTFKLSKDPQHLSHCAARRRRQVKRLGYRDKVYSDCAQVLQTMGEIGERASPAIQAPDNNDIQLALFSEFDQFLTLRASLGSAADVLDFSDDIPAAPLGVVLHSNHV